MFRRKWEETLGTKETGFSPVRQCCLFSWIA